MKYFIKLFFYSLGLILISTHSYAVNIPPLLTIQGLDYQRVSQVVGDPESTNPALLVYYQDSSKLFPSIYRTHLLTPKTITTDQAISLTYSDMDIPDLQTRAFVGKDPFAHLLDISKIIWFNKAYYAIGNTGSLFFDEINFNDTRQILVLKSKDGKIWHRAPDDNVKAISGKALVTIAGSGSNANPALVTIDDNGKVYYRHFAKQEVWKESGLSIPIIKKKNDLSISIYRDWFERFKRKMENINPALHDKNNHNEQTLTDEDGNPVRVQLSLFSYKNNFLLTVLTTTFDKNTFYKEMTSNEIVKIISYKVETWSSANGEQWTPIASPDHFMPLQFFPAAEDKLIVKGVDFSKDAAGNYIIDYNINDASVKIAEIDINASNKAFTVIKEVSPLLNCMQCEGNKTFYGDDLEQVTYNKPTNKYSFMFYKGEKENYYYNKAWINGVSIDTLVNGTLTSLNVKNDQSIADTYSKDNGQDNYLFPFGNHAYLLAGTNLQPYPYGQTDSYLRDTAIFNIN